MSGYFKRLRQDFIKAHLKTTGQIRRSDLMREFDISAPQATNDINEFHKENPGFMVYCPRTKVYVFRE